MKLKGPEYINSDVLVIGGGGAGLEAAIKAREKGVNVLLVSKSQVGRGNNTVLSAAAFAAATGGRDAGDNPDVHVQDMLEGGCFINDRRLAFRMASKILGEVPLLESYGVPFQKEGERLVISLAPGHSYHRHFHGAHRRGTDFSVPLTEYAAKSGVKFIERVFISRLLAQSGEIAGAAGIDREGRLLVFSAPAVVLATGGLGQIYRYTNNAAGMTGDGYALAFNLGLPLRDMEFVQFYPTATGGTRMILYEAFVFRTGAIIRNSRGEDILVKHNLQDPMLMTRDRLARAIMREILDGNDVDGGLIIDLSPVTDENFNRLRRLLPTHTPEERREFIVSPTAHFCIGGIVTDEDTRTAIPGLFACGEVVGGAHGANRLAGNALTEAFAMGAIAGENAAPRAKETPVKKPDPAEISAEKSRLESLLGKEAGSTGELLKSLKNVMWYQAGIIRHQSGLKEALDKIRSIRTMAGKVQVTDIKGLSRWLELDNMLLGAELISQAALERTESRGAHYREDYPDEDPGWQANLFITNTQGKIALEKRPVEP
ncbi:Fumarate reductase flavoprotein subunit [subsurface metagenome]